MIRRSKGQVRERSNGLAGFVDLGVKSVSTRSHRLDQSDTPMAKHTLVSARAKSPHERSPRGRLIDGPWSYGNDGERTCDWIML